MKTLPIPGLIDLLSITSYEGNFSINQDSANQNVEKFSDLMALNNSNFQAAKSITVGIPVENPGFSDPFRIEIYGFAPTVGESLICSGCTSGNTLSKS